jgi:hypothetical protein
MRAELIKLIKYMRIMSSHEGVIPLNRVRHAVSRLAGLREMFEQANVVRPLITIQQLVAVAYHVLAQLLLFQDLFADASLAREQARALQPRVAPGQRKVAMFKPFAGFVSPTYCQPQPVFSEIMRSQKARL